MYKHCKTIRCEHLKDNKCSFGELCVFTTNEIMQKQEIKCLNFWIVAEIVLFIGLLAIAIFKK